MGKQTPLYQAHVSAGGKMVDFAGYSLPIHYGSQIDEHHAVRNTAGMFDVSHMTLIDLAGSACTAWLQGLLTNDVGKLADGQALYSCLCNHAGGVIDDLIAYRLDALSYRLIVNAATRAKVLAWLNQRKPDDIELHQPADMALLAVQGPKAISLCSEACASLSTPVSAVFQGSEVTLARFTAQQLGDWFFARTGYTGEDGLEIALPADQVEPLWQALLRSGVTPAGLGARDTLRLEAGMSLYGNELDEHHSPVESGIAWTVDLRDESRQFIGREVLQEHKQLGTAQQLIGLKLDGRGVLRGGQSVELAGKTIGTITSGTYSPSLQQSIALARVDQAFTGGCDVLIRGKQHAAHQVSVPFVSDGDAND